MARKLEIGDNLAYGLFLLFMVLLGIFALKYENDTPKDEKSRAVIIEQIKNNEFKVQYLEDRTVKIKYLGKGYVVGDTVSTSK